MADNVVNITVTGKDEASPAMKSAADSGKGLGGVFGDLGKGLAVFSLAAEGFGKLAGAAEGFLGKASEIGGEVRTLQSVIGGTAEDSSRLRFAFEELGIPIDKAQVGLKRFSVALSGTGGIVDGIAIPSGKALTEMLGSMGISADDAGGHARSMTDILGDTAEVFAGMPNGVEKTTLAVKLFGKSGTDMIPMLNKGKEGLTDLMKESDKLGLTLNQGQLDALKKQKLAMREMGAAVDGLKLQIGLALAPAMTFLAVKGAELAAMFTSKVIPVIKEIAGWIGDKLSPVFHAVSEDIQNFANVLSGALSGDLLSAADSFNKLPGPLQDFALTLADVKVKVEDMAGVFKNDILPAMESFGSKVADVLLPALQQLGELIATHKDDVAAFATAVILGVVVPAFIAWAVAAGTAAVATIIAAAPVIALGLALGLLGVAIFEVIKHHDAIWAKMKEVWGWVDGFLGGVLSDLVSLVKSQFDAIRTEIEAAFEVVKDIFKVAMDLIHGDWGKAWEDLKTLTHDVITLIWDEIKRQLDLVVGLFTIAWDAVNAATGGALDELKNSVANALGNMRDVATYAIEFIKNTIVQGFGYVQGAVGAIWSGIEDAIVDPIRRIIDWIQRVIDKARDLANLGGIAGSIISHAMDLVGFAGGGVSAGGLAIVGENGPELVNLPAGAQVHSNADSQRMMSGGQSVNVHISGPVTINNQQDIDSTAGKIGWSIALGMRARGVWA